VVSCTSVRSMARDGDQSVGGQNRMRLRRQPGCDQFRESDAGRGIAEGQARRPNPCLITGRGRADIAIKWHGWHGFRRGLATNLHQLGVAGKTIQRILRTRT
jgi:hypothetical protein